jgi:radical SAM protein with 4Fe4S-binding SPASM domain
MVTFKRIYIEISNLCNIQCSFCPVVERDNKIMSIEDFQKILMQVKPLTQEICLHLMGEPLAHPKIRDIFQLCDKENVKVQLTTNGLLLKRYQDDLLQFKNLRQINFSLQSYKDNFPHKDLRQYLIPLMGFTRLLNEHNPDSYVNFRLWNVGSETLENEEIYQEIEKFYKVKLNRTVDVTNIKSKKIWQKVYLHFDSRFEWPSFDLPFQGENGRCHGLSGQLGIHANGVVVPCCLDKEAKINLGNCLEEDLTKILQSQRAVAIRDGFKHHKRVESFCQHCSYINRFK